LLLVDDDAGVRRALSRMLGRMGIEVHAESSGPAAVRWLSARPTAVDVVLTDLAMPETDGLEFARQVGAIRRDLPIVLFTGRDDPDLRTAAAQMGIADVLMKPIDRDELHGALKRAISPATSVN
jgi:DNA-binding NtrC family response regulator